MIRHCFFHVIPLLGSFRLRGATFAFDEARR